MTDWIETERTRLRPFEEADAEAAFAWFSDPEVMKFIPGGLDVTLTDTRRRIAGYRDHQSRHGFSKRLILHRETGQAIGDSGLHYLPDGKRSLPMSIRIMSDHNACWRSWDSSPPIWSFFSA